MPYLFKQLYTFVDLVIYFSNVIRCLQLFAVLANSLKCFKYVYIFSPILYIEPHHTNIANLESKSCLSFSPRRLAYMHISIYAAASSKTYAYFDLHFLFAEWYLRVHYDSPLLMFFSGQPDGLVFMRAQCDKRGVRKRAYNVARELS